ncbi:trimethylamine methyltransferase family protein [Desulforhopalus singaporensis]|uniref:trimethylamine methyltransferase family protein n=1 Tax=Desulforhopalus singaporensis TaxID=91360 RepID=UPI0015A0E789|nr:trimethylamine methyltransferase family protein [Desulforhopalus singaporensis]
MSKSKQQYGNETLYNQIQEDALLLIESYGVAVSPVAAAKLLAAMPRGEAAQIVYTEETGRFYISRETVEKCLDRTRQGMEFWPAGFGTGGMAAYIVDNDTPRSPDNRDMKRLAELFGRTDILTNLQSSFNICSRVKKNDIATRERTEVTAIDDMVAAADGKLIMPTVYSDAAYDRLRYFSTQGHRVGVALSIISTYMSVSEEMVDPFLKAAVRGLPYIMNSMPIGGLTGPYSMSSLATLAQAESVFGLVLGQLVNPGIKCINAAMPTIADMTKKDMPMMFGSVANAMLNILLAELNMHLGIPTCQSACSHHRDSLDDEAVRRSGEIYSLVNQYDFHIMRHLFGFSSQLNDFNIDNMEQQIELYHQISRQPLPVTLPQSPEYDAEGLNAIFEGFDRQDFRGLDHTLQNIGHSFRE